MLTRIVVALLLGSTLVAAQAMGGVVSNGNVTINGGGNGIVFPDGSRQTSAVTIDKLCGQIQAANLPSPSFCLSPSYYDGTYECIAFVGTQVAPVKFTVVAGVVSGTLQLVSPVSLTGAITPMVGGMGLIASGGGATFVGQIDPATKTITGVASQPSLGEGHFGSIGYQNALDGVYTSFDGKSVDVVAGSSVNGYTLLESNGIVTLITRSAVIDLKTFTVNGFAITKGKEASRVTGRVAGNEIEWFGANSTMR